MQALIQYPDPVAANNAKTALEGHAIYDGGYNRVSLLLLYNRQSHCQQTFCLFGESRCPHYTLESSCAICMQYQPPIAHPLYIVNNIHRTQPTSDTCYAVEDLFLCPQRPECQGSE